MRTTHNVHSQVRNALPDGRRGTFQFRHSAEKYLQNETSLNWKRPPTREK